MTTKKALVLDRISPARRNDLGLAFKDVTQTMKKRAVRKNIDDCVDALDAMIEAATAARNYLDKACADDD